MWYTIHLLWLPSWNGEREKNCFCVIFSLFFFVSLKTEKDKIKFIDFQVLINVVHKWMYCSHFTAHQNKEKRFHSILSQLFEYIRKNIEIRFLVQLQYICLYTENRSNEMVIFHLNFILIKFFNLWIVKNTNFSVYENQMGDFIIISNFISTSHWWFRFNKTVLIE